MTDWSDRIRTQLRRMADSTTFSKATRLRKYLEFVVEHAVDRTGQGLKEVSIGIELYALGQDFDPRLSSVVRVDATRLRSKLLEYYSTEGVDDPIIIDLPRGTYTPVFREARNEQQLPNPNRSGAFEAAIAVLPFSNLSPDPEEYFSDGLAEEIIHALSSIYGIRVAARSSAFVFRHRNSDVREIGRTLNVDFVLEGSVRKSGKDLRVNVQLVNAAEGYQVWSRRYDRQLEDVFAVQDDIAGEVVKLLQTGRNEPSGRYIRLVPSDFEAYSLFLQGRYHLNRQSRAAFHSAIDCFTKALARFGGRFSPIR